MIQYLELLLQGYDWNFDFLRPYASAFFRATLVTISLSVCAFVLGTLLGSVSGVVLRFGPLPRLSLLLNDCLRAVPVLVLLFIFYYLPYKSALGIEAPNAFIASVLGIAVSQMAYTADLVRAAIDGVPRGVVDGARALGLEEVTIWTHIVIPDIIRPSCFFYRNCKAFQLGICNWLSGVSFRCTHRCCTKLPIA
jgi:polar amino acid transport system permease protein